jgi:hypothetical protein
MQKTPKIKESIKQCDYDYSVSPNTQVIKILNGTVFNESLFAKYLSIRRHELISGLSWHLSGGTDENHKKSEMG